MAIKKTILKKKIEGTVYDIYQKTSADLVEYDSTTTVAAKIASLATDLGKLTTGDASVDTKIQAASDALFQKIMGVTDQSQLDSAFDTLQEVSAYLASHGTVVDGFTSDISNLKSRMSTVEGKVTTLEGTVGNSSKGLVKDVATLKNTVGSSTSGLVADTAANTAAISTANGKISALETAVGNASSGVVKKANDNATAIAALQAVGATKVEKSTTNGNIKINGTETTVYTAPTSWAGSKVTQDSTHRFVTDTEKAAWNADAKVIVAKSVPSDLAEKDLLFLDITA